MRDEGKASAPRLHKALLMALLLLGSSPAVPAQPVSMAPLLALGSYLERNGTCSEELIAWNRRHLERLASGEIARNFYFRTLSFQNWGACGRPYVKRVFSELQKSWQIHTLGKISAKQYEDKEHQVTDLLMAAMKTGAEGEGLVAVYEEDIASRLLELEPDQQYFNCTYFGNEPQCID